MGNWIDQVSPEIRKQAVALAGMISVGNDDDVFVALIVSERERFVDIVHRLCDPELAKAITREIRGVETSPNGLGAGT